MNFKSSWNRFIALATILVASANIYAATDFTLKSATDAKTFKLSDANGKFVALHFLLKTECPVCIKHTREYARHAAAAPEVVHIFIKPDTEEEIKAWSASLGENPPITIYRDPDAQLAKQFKVPDGYQFHGQSVHYPALILLNGTGMEVFRYVGKNNTDRYPIDQFVTKLAELRGKKASAIQQYNLGPDRVAINGYDPVSYFTKGRAEKGNEQITSKYREVQYRFSSLENKKAFSANPEKYLPTYGGWCATAMAKGEKVEIDPTNFKVTNGRLFLFFKAFYANALKDWNKDEANLTAKADAHWKQISGE